MKVLPTISTVVLLVFSALPQVVMADDLDCTLATCGFGEQVATLSGNQTVAFPDITIVDSTTSDVYLNQGVYTYLYEFTQSANVPIATMGVITVGPDLAPTPWSGALNYGVVTDLTTAGLNDCGDTGGLGCGVGGFGFGNGTTTSVIGLDLGFQFGVASFGTGISSSSTSTTDTFAFYGQSYGAPVSGGAGAALRTSTGEGVYGSVPGVLVPGQVLPSSPVAEPGTLLLLGTGMFGLGLLHWRRKSRASGLDGSPALLS